MQRASWALRAHGATARARGAAAAPEQRGFAAAGRGIASSSSTGPVLLVNHGYPPTYNAGSEVYTQLLARGLAARGAPAAVFSREEDPLRPDYALRAGADGGVLLRTVNNARAVARFADARIDDAFERVLAEASPRVVHFQHLNHLSTSLPAIAKRRGMLNIFTLHDFWLLCPRGQFLQYGVSGDADTWPLCDGQQDAKCAERCMNRYWTGAAALEADDGAYWRRFVAARQEAVRAAMQHVDVFIAPSRHLRDRFVDEGGLPRERVVLLDYGFDHARLAGRARAPGEPFTFGFIGRHMPAKGVDALLSAFRSVRGNARLRVWGRPEGQLTAALRALAGGDARVEWRHEYSNEHIVTDVLNHCDALVVPSIWEENSPLVIHEVQQARLPVITADAGGMGEFVKDGVNGLTYEHRSVPALRDALQRGLDGSRELLRMGARGYLYSEDGNVPCITEHIDTLTRVYERAAAAATAPRTAPPPLFRRAGPWRMTFDTNPDDCNYACVMCEGFSEHSDVRATRAASGARRRRMDPALIERAVRAAAPHGLREIIPSTMGEPLMYRHFDIFLSLCRELGLKLNLTTNGSFPSNGVRAGVDAWAAALLPVLSDVKFSWNAATAATQERVMRRASFGAQLDNLKAFLRARDAAAALGGNRASVTLQLTFMEMNADEFPELVALAASLGVDRVKGHHLWAHWDAMRRESFRRDAAAKARWNDIAARCARVAAATPRLSGGRVRLEGFGALPTGDAVPALVAPDAACPFLGAEVWVNSRGRLDPCCAPDAQRAQLGAFGDVTRPGGIMAMWRSPDYRELMRTYGAHPVCAQCNMRRKAEAGAA